VQAKKQIIDGRKWAEGSIKEVENPVSQVSHYKSNAALIFIFNKFMVYLFFIYLSCYIYVNKGLELRTCAICGDRYVCIYRNYV
jgi:hypothetical protein